MALPFRPLLSDSSMNSKYARRRYWSRSARAAGRAPSPGKPLPVLAEFGRESGLVGGHLIGRFCRWPPSPNRREVEWRFRDNGRMKSAE